MVYPVSDVAFLIEYVKELRQGRIEEERSLEAVARRCNMPNATAVALRYGYLCLNTAFERNMVSMDNTDRATAEATVPNNVGHEGAATPIYTAPEVFVTQETVRQPTGPVQAGFAPQDEDYLQPVDGAWGQATRVYVADRVQRARERMRTSGASSGSNSMVTNPTHQVSETQEAVMSFMSPVRPFFAPHNAGYVVDSGWSPSAGTDVVAQAPRTQSALESMEYPLFPGGETRDWWPLAAGRR